MHVGRSIVLVPVFALAIAGSAFGQQPAQSGRTVAPGQQRGYVAALAGAVSGPPVGTVFSVEYGENVRRHAQVYATLSYFENLMSQSMRNELATLGTSLSAFTGTAWNLSGRDRGVALATGAKYLVGSGAVRPYFGAGAGVLILKRTVTEARIGDVTAAVFNDFDIGESSLSLSATSLKRPLAEGAIGVGIVAGSTYVDVGYRYRKAFRLTKGLDVSQLSVGVGYRF